MVSLFHCRSCIYQVHATPEGQEGPSLLGPSLPKDFFPSKVETVADHGVCQRIGFVSNWRLTTKIVTNGVGCVVGDRFGYCRPLDIDQSCRSAKEQLIECHASD